MSTDGAKKQPISRKSVLVSQGWSPNQSAFTSIPVSAGLSGFSSGNLYAGIVMN